MAADVESEWLWGTPPSAGLRDLAAGLDEGNDPPGATVIKSGRTRTVFAVPELGVLVKRFRGEGGWRASLARREYRMMEAFCRAGLPTTRPIGCGERFVNGTRTEAFFFAQLVPDARTLADVLEVAPECDVHTWIERAVDVVARLHEHPFHHRDLHAGNLLVDEHDALQIIDLHSVWRVRELSNAQRAATLAELLYSLRGRMSLDDVSHWAARYAEVRGERVDEVVPRVVSAVGSFARDHIRGRAARCMRRSSEFVHGTASLEPRGYVWRRREVTDVELTDAWQDFRAALRHPEGLLGNARRSQVARLHDGAWVGKSFRERGLLPGLRAKFGTGRGRSAWRAGRRLEVVDIPTPRTLALVEWSDGSALLIVEHVAGRTLRERLNDTQLTCAERVGLAEAVGWLVGRLWREGLHHPDMSTKNLLVADNGTMPAGRDRRTRAVPGTPLVLLIDLDNLRELEPHDGSMLTRMLGQLGDVPSHLTRTDRRRFERALERTAGRAIPRDVAAAAAARVAARQARREALTDSTSAASLA